MPTQFERELENYVHGSLPIKEKLVVLDRDIIDLKIADKDITKSVHKLQGLIKLQMLLLMFNLLMSGGIVYVIIQNMFI